MKILKFLLLVIPLILLVSSVRSMEEEVSETQVSINSSSFGQRLIDIVGNKNAKNATLFDRKLLSISKTETEKKPLILGFKTTKSKKSSLEKKRRKVAKLLEKYSDEDLMKDNKHLRLLSSYIVQELDEYAKEKDKKQWWSSLKKIGLSIIGSSAFTGLVEYTITNMPNWINNGNSTDVPYSNATMPPGFNGTMFW